MPRKHRTTTMEIGSGAVEIDQGAWSSPSYQIPHTMAQDGRLRRGPHGPYISCTLYGWTVHDAALDFKPYRDVAGDQSGERSSLALNRRG